MTKIQQIICAIVVLLFILFFILLVIKSTTGRKTGIGTLTDKQFKYYRSLQVGDTLKPRELDLVGIHIIRADGENVVYKVYWHTYVTTEPKTRIIKSIWYGK